MAGSATGMGFRRIALAQGLLEGQTAAIPTRGLRCTDLGYVPQREAMLAYAYSASYAEPCRNDAEPDHFAQYR